MDPPPLQAGVGRFVAVEFHFRIVLEIENLVSEERLAHVPYSLFRARHAIDKEAERADYYDRALQVHLVNR